MSTAYASLDLLDQPSLWRGLCADGTFAREARQPFAFRKAVTEQEKPEIYALRGRVFVEAAGLEKPTERAIVNGVRQVIERDHFDDEADHYYFRRPEDLKVVACFRLIDSRKSAVMPLQAYCHDSEMAKVLISLRRAGRPHCELSRMTADPEYHRSPVLLPEILFGGDIAARSQGHEWLLAVVESRTARVMDKMGVPVENVGAAFDHTTPNGVTLKSQGIIIDGQSAWKKLGRLGRERYDELCGDLHNQLGIVAKHEVPASSSAFRVNDFANTQ